MRKMAKVDRMFAERLKKVLSDKKVSVRVLAKKARIHHSMIYAFRDGKHAPSLASAQRIAEALGYSLSEFIEDPKANEGHSVEECWRRVSAEWKRCK